MNQDLHTSLLASATEPAQVDDVVLIVDDQPVDRMVTEHIVSEHAGRRVVTVDSGQAALEYLEYSSVDLVLLDVMMPGMDGYETARRIRTREHLCDVPILFLTGSEPADGLVDKGFSAGAYDYILKPPNPEMLNNKVAIFLRLYRQQQTLARELERRRQAEDALRLSAIVFEHSPQGVLITDANSVIRNVNGAFEQTTGYSAAEVIGQTPQLLQSGRYDQDFYHQFWQTLKDTDQWHGEIWNRRKDGRVYPEWLNVVAVRNGHNEVTNYVGIFSDLSGRDQLQERLHEFAYFDPLTRLPNRQMLLDRLRLVLAQARRGGSNFTVVFLDLDRFKRINDTLGYQVGDVLLQAVAQRLQSQVREIDTCARLDGDVFALLLSGLSESEDAARMVQQLLMELGAPYTVDEHAFHLNFSAGISVYPYDGETPEELFKHAETALHRSKESGGGVQFYESAMSVRCRERLELENDLRHAIENNGLSLAFQPQVSLDTGRLIAVEALARWHHPQLGAISPGRFIPVAEDAGLIGALGSWVLEHACRQAVAWRNEHGHAIRVAVNVSAHQLRNGGLEDEVARVLEQAGLSPDCLELELTESMLMEAVDNTMCTLQRLNAMGVELSIDDFGTGYSSLSYLKRFSIPNLKIDRSFVCDVATDPNSAAIVEAVIAMAHRLNLRVVAEGVELFEQLEFLRRSECDVIQGFLFSQPVVAAEITRLREIDFVKNVSQSKG